MSVLHRPQPHLQPHTYEPLATHIESDDLLGCCVYATILSASGILILSRHRTSSPTSSSPSASAMADDDRIFINATVETGCARYLSHCIASPPILVPVVIPFFRARNEERLPGRVADGPKISSVDVYHPKINESRHRDHLLLYKLQLTLLTCKKCISNAVSNSSLQKVSNTILTYIQRQFLTLTNIQGPREFYTEP